MTDPRSGAALTLATLVLASAGCGRGESPAETVHADGLTSVPMADAGPPLEGTRFERLDASRTGIDFVHRWAPPPEHAHRLNTSATVSGVAVGDYDGDGLPDVVLTSPHGGNRLYRNLGEFRFEDVTARAGIDGAAWGAGVTFADVDGDEDLDLYLCVFDGPNRLYVNRGDGTFVEDAAGRGLDFSGASTMMAFADYDLDGDLDAYLLTNNNAPLEIPKFKSVAVDGVPAVPERYREVAAAIRMPGGRYGLVPAAQYDHLYRNDGQGRFTDVSEQAGIAGNHFGLSVTWWDYDDDGFPDIYVANDFFGPDQLYRNDGDGTFTDVAKEALPHTPWFSMGADAADVDNDGRFDLLSSDMAGSTHYTRKTSTGDAEHPWFYEVANPPQYMRNALYLNSGTPRFFEAAFLAGVARTDWTWSVKFADLDDDGRVDLFVSNGMTRDWLDGDLMLRARNEFGRPSLSRHYLDSPPRAEADLAFRNLGDLKFEEVAEAWGLDAVEVSFGAALGDLDLDGDLDLVVSNFEARPAVYRNRSTGNHRLRIRLRGTVSNRWGIGTKVTLTAADGSQTRYLSLAHGVMSADEPELHFGLGNHTRAERLTLRWPSGRVQQFENLEADRRYTVTEPRGAAPQRAPAPPRSTLFVPSDALADARRVEASFDDYALQPLLPRRLSRMGPGLAWGDVDGDGDDDVYVGAPKGRWEALYLNLGNGRFEPGANDAFRRNAECEDMAPLFFDADGDGDLDLYVVSGGVESPPGAETLRDRLYLNDGKGRFTTARAGALPDLRDSGGAAAAADFDRDGDVDVFVGGRVVPGGFPRTPESRLLLNDGKGMFRDGAATHAEGLGRTGLVTSAVWSDVDDDGWLDLLMTHHWGPVKLWVNERGRLVERTRQAGLAGRTGWWNGIAAGDVDHDGDIDYAVTNLGLNTQYHASAQRPAVLLYGDFDGSGTRNVVEAEYDGDVLVPVLGRDALSAAMPLLAEEFPTYDAFARASVEELFPRGLDGALRLEANTFESGVFVNDGRGAFEFAPLPRLAQISPGFGAVVSDVDGDGAADLYVVQNAFDPRHETGRFDGGLSLLLEGNGDGTFEPVWPDDSGLIVPGDAKGLTRADVDGDGAADFVVGINDGEVMTFLNRASTPERTARVRLRGRPGNPSAIGSRITVRLSDGSRRTAEVHAGGSYLSQSSPVAFFGLGAGGGIAGVEVRWPDGTVSSHTIADPRVEIAIEQPPRP